MRLIDARKVHFNLFQVISKIRGLNVRKSYERIFSVFYFPIYNKDFKEWSYNEIR